MRIVFMGTPDFAVPSLDALLHAGHKPVAVVTAPDKPRGRGLHLAPTPVKRYALEHGLHILQPSALKDESFLADLRACAPDIIVVVAFRILPEQVFTLATMGSFNLHASLLPKYRGAAPINWALINGEPVTGVTTFFLERSVDTGRIIEQEQTPIGEDDDAGTLHDRLAALGAAVVVRTVEKILAGNVVTRVQDNTFSTPAPKLFPEDCHIRWDVPSEQTWGFIRGMSPHPGAFSTHDGRTLKIYRTRRTRHEAAQPPGSIIAGPQTLHVATADTLLEILEIQQEGRKRMTVEEFLRGYRFSPGARFE